MTVKVEVRKPINSGDIEEACDNVKRKFRHTKCMADCHDVAQRFLDACDETIRGVDRTDIEQRIAANERQIELDRHKLAELETENQK